MKALLSSEVKEILSDREAGRELMNYVIKSSRNPNKTTSGTVTVKSNNKVKVFNVSSYSLEETK